jgi:hypothetical protein
MTARARTFARPRTALGGGTAALGFILVAAACGSVRPYVRPLPGAPTDTLQVEAAQLITVVHAVLLGEGLQIRVNSPEEGYLETEWYDLGRRQSGGERTRRPHDVVRFRFFADPLSDEEAVLVSEVVYRISLDPSVPVRQREVLVTADHPAYEMLERIWSTVQMVEGTTGG